MICLVFYFDFNFVISLIGKPMKAGDGDGKMPLHFHIHIQTKSAWGLFETLTRVMHDLNLEIVDHRTSHTRGLDPLILNDIFVKDGDVSCVSNSMVQAARFF